MAFFGVSYGANISFGNRCRDLFSDIYSMANHVPDL